MSTRSIIVFTSKRKEEIELTKAGNVRISQNRIKSCLQDPHIYVHWDGYPSNRLRQIVNYMSLPQVRTYDVEYCSAWFIPYLISSYEANRPIENERDCTGYGINGNLDIGFCTYIYIVHCTGKTVTIVDAWNKKVLGEFDLQLDNFDEWIEEWESSE